MLKRGFYIWRLVWTAFAFAALSVGGFILAMTVIPIVTLFVSDEQTRNRRAQTIIRESFRFYIGMLRGLGVLRLEVVGAERLSACRGKLIIANHPTLIDIVLLTALLPNAKCVVKSELFTNRLLRSLVRSAGYIRNDYYEPEVLIEKCRETLAAGDNLIIFPEGTRSVPGKPLHFQRGFAHIATLTGATVQPITITCDPITLVKGEPYYKIPDSPPKFRVEVADEIDPSQFLKIGSESRARGARRLVSFLEADYSARLNHA
ncbi:MAG: lysophospholipid acyltransferase family protein [Candidatus Binataceae bacterium]